MPKYQVGVHVSQPKLCALLYNRSCFNVMRFANTTHSLVSLLMQDAGPVTSPTLIEATRLDQSKCDGTCIHRMHVQLATSANQLSTSCQSCVEDRGSGCRQPEWTSLHSGNSTGAPFSARLRGWIRANVTEHTFIVCVYNVPLLLTRRALFCVFELHRRPWL
jgi:hypothetical protein